MTVANLISTTDTVSARKVYFATAYPTPWSYIPRFAELAEKDRVGTHRMTLDPDEADIILFVDARHEHNDWRFKKISQHALNRKYPWKCFVYNETDQPWCFMPGIYVSMPQTWFKPSKMAAWSYIGLMNPHILDPETDVDPDLLCCFSGRRCVPVRDAILALKPTDDMQLEDTTAYNFFGDAHHSGAEMQTRMKSYATLLKRSKFVLCPRGSGPSSFRLFETLAAGRVPVIISDQWVPPQGPDWEACSLRVRENHVGDLVGHLRERLADWPQMAQAAKATWRDWFAPDVQFHGIVEACARLHRSLWPHIIDGRRMWLEARHLKASFRSYLSNR